MSELSIVSDFESSSRSYELELSPEAHRAIQEVQASLIIAKRFPRDQKIAYSKIMTACTRKNLAKTAMYAFNRGGKLVTGPSIKLAEVIAQSWGNIDWGLIETSNDNGSSRVMSYAWDKETNTRQTREFLVKHERKANGAIQKIIDPRDVYEHVASQGQRRVRACIIGVIPPDVIDDAIKACERTVLGSNDEPIGDRIREMIVAFAKFGIDKDMIEHRLDHSIDVMNEEEILELRKIYASIRDGMAKREEFFELAKKQGASAAGVAADVNEKLRKKREKVIERVETEPSNDLKLGE